MLLVSGQTPSTLGGCAQCPQSGTSAHRARCCGRSGRLSVGVRKPGGMPLEEVTQAGPEDLDAWEQVQEFGQRKDRQRKEGETGGQMKL